MTVLKAMCDAHEQAASNGHVGDSIRDADSTAVTCFLVVTLRERGRSQA